MITTTVSLTRGELLAHEPCAEGLALFDAIAPSGSTEIEWTILHDLWLSVAYPGFANWLRQQRLIPLANLVGANLVGANLVGAYLGGADLRGAYLRGAYLVGADLRGADLRGAYLVGADLRGADLGGAYLEGCLWSERAEPPAGWRLVDGRLCRA